SRAGISASWKEHQIGSADAPTRVRGYGSPTILVEGVDVGGLTAGAESCCRVYESGGAPRVEVIAEALRRADRADVASGQRAPVPETRCRANTSGGAPGVEVIAEALRRADREDVAPGQQPPTQPRSRWKSTAAVLTGIGIALMPKVVCPLCWPAYAGILSAAGLTFLMEDRWLLPISAVFLLAALAALAWRARSRRGHGPLGGGAASAAGP